MTSAFFIGAFSFRLWLLADRRKGGCHFFSQPFYVAQQFTGMEGKYVKLEETLKRFVEIIEGKADYRPEQAFLYVGGIDGVRAKAKAMAK